MNYHLFSDLNIQDLPKFTKAEKPRGRWTRCEYNRQLCAFDIETSALHDIQQSFMYIWQFAIENFVIIGRTWEELKKLVNWLNILSYNRKIVVYVHNLSYEFQFLSGIFHFENEDVFAVEPRKILRANYKQLEFRCSYLLTNLSLYAMTKRYNVQHQKLSGEEFNYNILRFPDTPLSEKELAYCINDVLGLIESVHAIMELNNDDVYTIPLTSTGFVRRICKNAMRSSHKQILAAYPDYEVFKLLRKAFRGGNTHANRYYADEIISGPVYSMDITSSYPFQQVCKEFPVYPFEIVHSTSIRYIDHLIDNGKAVLFAVGLSNVELRNRYTPVPYIPFDKCTVCRQPVLDNGRVLRAEYLEIVVTDIDWKIIVKQYQFTAEVIQAYKTGYGKLQDGIRESNIEFYANKTTLKGIKGQELFYMKNKELLNSIYGMSVQNPVKRNLLFNDTCIIPNLYIEDDSMSDEEILQKSRKKAFTCYQFGVWTTAHARDSLENGIDIVGETLLYCDTDSCKYIGERDFSEYNRKMQQMATAGGLVARDKNGVPHYGGVYELDGIYDAFITQGAKKYAYIENGEIHLTLAGVSKRAGAAALSAAGGLDAFREGFIFHNCGKTESIYNDTGAGVRHVQGHEINITRNVYIHEQDYTLGRTDDYTSIINVSKRDLQKLEKFLDVMQK